MSRHGQSTPLFLVIVLVLGLTTACGTLVEATWFPVEEVTYPIPANTLDAGKAAAFQSMLDKYIEAGFPGVVIMVDGGSDGFWAAAAGYACIEMETPMTVYNLFHTGSHPKIHTAAAALLLMEDGLLNLDAPISGYLPGSVGSRVPNSHRITVRQLLNHTSGLPDFDWNPALFFKRMNAPPQCVPRAEILEVIYAQKPNSEPGERHDYADANYFLLAVTMDNVLGRDHGAYFAERIYEPLGMSHTYYRDETDYYYPDYPPGMVNLYTDRYQNGFIHNSTDVNHAWLTSMPGCDGLIAAPYDLLVFVRNLFSANVVSAESLEQMVNAEQIIYDDEDDSYYGLGVYIKGEPGSVVYYQGHSGSTQGSGMTCMYFPDLDYAIAVCVNVGIQNETYGALWNALWEEMVRIITE